MICNTITESLILAQNERWRRVLNMQVERNPLSLLRGESGERVSNTWIICLVQRNNRKKFQLKPYNLFLPHGKKSKHLWAQEESASD